MFNDDELNRLLKYSYSLCGERENAFDLLQSSLEKVLIKKDKMQIQFPIRYMMRVMRNLYINSLRRSKFEAEVEVDFENEVVSLDDINIERMDVKKILSMCTPEEREILYLWAYEGMSYEEIAKYLEVSRGTLLSRVHYLKKRLLKEIEGGGL